MHVSPLVFFFSLDSFLSSIINLCFFVVYFSSSASPESGLGTSHTSLPGSGQGSAHENPNDDYEPEVLQPLGTCLALYPFDGELIFNVKCFS